VKSSLDFGEVAAGTTKTMPLEIWNGGTELTISEIEIEGADFEMEDVELPLIIAQDQTVTLNIHLTPSTSTERIGTVRVTSDDPSSPIAEAKLLANELCGVFDRMSGLLEGTVVGETYTTTVTLTNCSEIVEIHVTDFSHSPNGNPNYSSDFTFSEVVTPVILAPGDDLSFDVIFQPLVPGDHAVHYTLSTTGTLGINRSQLTGRLVALGVRE